MFQLVTSAFGVSQQNQRAEASLWSRYFATSLKNHTGSQALKKVQRAAEKEGRGEEIWSDNIGVNVGR